ncbi:MAG: CRISPR-associated helicase Cas3' [Bacteroidota bacterium]
MNNNHIPDQPSKNRKTKEFVAHVKQNPDNTWEKHFLKEHLNGVANKSGEFASEFGNRDWGEVLGYWHDLGKFLPAWQNYIRRETGFDSDAHIEGKNNRPNHSTAGAVLSFDKLKNPAVSRLIAYGIAGHHAGLPDAEAPSIGDALDTRIFKNPFNPSLDADEISIIKQINEAKEFLDKEFPRSAPLNISKKEDSEKSKEHFHLWVRMLFSCLVDADFLDTEKFMDPEQHSERGNYLSMIELKERFDKYIKEKKSDSPLNKKRNQILEQCRSKAKLKPGFFSLTVPTGGGKTLSSMGFALEHAILHNKKRIITAIPYTSIIEQTAKVFKYGTDNDDEIEDRIKTDNVLFGEEQVIEHHSNLDPEKETSKNRLASENWDAPIIVTTNVQLFESLFESKSSSCRKLHNIVNSVIILDEVQMLQPEYLKPILSALRGLVEHFGVTVVLMTATQPSLIGKIGSDSNSFEGLTDVTNIIENPEILAKEFKRVELEMPSDLSLRKEWKDIAEELTKHNQVLCIVNTRNDCRQLHSLMPGGTIHLSAFMCGEERSEIISGIKQKLRNGKPVRVISTQLVEAGVDIDFPVVYRALAGLDSIAQAAGRCNRENKLAAEGKRGKVVVFNPPKEAPTGLLRKGEDACKSILRTNNIKELTPEIFTKYFQQFYPNLNDFDKPRFYEQLVKEADEFKFQFRTLAHDFKLIDDVQKSIVVLYENQKSGFNSERLINELQFKGPSKQLGRKLQRFIVNVPMQIFNKLVGYNYIKELNGYYIQNDPTIYKPGLGLLGNETDWIYGNGVV